MVNGKVKPRIDGCWVFIIIIVVVFGTIAYFGISSQMKHNQKLDELRAQSEAEFQARMEVHDKTNKLVYEAKSHKQPTSYSQIAEITDYSEDKNIRIGDLAVIPENQVVRFANPDPINRNVPQEDRLVEYGDAIEILRGRVVCVEGADKTRGVLVSYIFTDTAYDGLAPNGTMFWVNTGEFLIWTHDYYKKFSDATEDQLLIWELLEQQTVKGQIAIEQIESERNALLDEVERIKQELIELDIAALKDLQQIQEKIEQYTN